MIVSLNHINAGFLEKCISVHKLKEILAQLEDTDLLYPNRVGNLNINRNEQDIGWLDIGSEVVERFDDIESENNESPL